MKMNKNEFLICLDCEMTGLDHVNDKVIEVGAVKFNLNETVDSFESLINPDMPVPIESFKIHGISDEILKGAPKPSDVLPRLFAFLGVSPIIVGHNVGVDISMLTKDAEAIGMKVDFSPKIIDTVRLARAYGDSANNSLESLAVHFNVSLDGSHRAMNDVVTNIAVFKHLSRRYKTLNAIFDVLAKPIKMKYMPLGKYKGKRFSEIPINYLRWAKNMEFDLDLIFSIKSAIKERQKSDSFSQSSNPFSSM